MQLDPWPQIPDTRDMGTLSKIAIIILPLFFIFNSLLSPKAIAQSQFETAYQVTYTAGEKQTEVVQKIALKNKTANYYADSFELKIGSTKVENVTARDSVGPMEANSKFENNLTIISVKFNQRVIGLDKTNDFTISYNSADLATKSGQIWEIAIPRLAKSDDITSYQAKVAVPLSFGKITSTLPTPKEIKQAKGSQEFTFVRDQLFESGISMIFGEKQVFALKLDYYLKNPSLTSQIQNIALPPDNNYQTVLIEKIDPEPQNVIVDEDGNFLAKYRLAPRSELDIKVEGYVEVRAKPQRKIVKTLTQKEKETNLAPQRYWEQDAFIKQKANELKTPGKIYDFVSTFLTYDAERLKNNTLERKGAAAATISPKESVCMEFTDLFIAIARSAGIPAREVEGYAYTQNERLRPLSLGLNQGDILHAWPEYWDDTLGWIQIDPTWAQTSGGLDYFNALDFNHIAFVHRGLSSTAPYPAGAYKRPTELAKRAVDISFAQNLPQPLTNPGLSLEIPQKILSGVPIKVTAEVKNIGNVTIIGSQLKITTSYLTASQDINTPFSLSREVSEEIPILPPFGQRQLESTMQSTGFFRQATDTIILSFEKTQLSKPIEIVPLYQIFFIREFAASVIIAAVFIGIGLIIYLRYRQRKQPHLRGEV